MSKKKQNLICPFNPKGCEYDYDDMVNVCFLWKPRIGCLLEDTLKYIKTIPNKLKRIEDKIEECGIKEPK